MEKILQRVPIVYYDTYYHAVKFSIKETSNNPRNNTVGHKKLLFSDIKFTINNLIVKAYVKNWAMSIYYNDKEDCSKWP